MAFRIPQDVCYKTLRMHPEGFMSSAVGILNAVDPIG